MTERIWLKNYPPGVPADIDPGQYSSLVELIGEALREHGDRKAYVLLDHAMTYGEVDRQAAAFSAWLQAQGFARGDRIALMLPNVLQYPIALLGALRAGLVIVNTNPLYTADELRHQLQDSGATAILVLENFAHVLQKVVGETAVKKVIVTGVGDLLPGLKGKVVNFVLRHVKKQVPTWKIAGALNFADIVREFAGRAPSPVTLTHADLAFLQYTGGRYAFPRQHGRQRAAVPCVVPAGADRARHLLHRAAAVSHLFADRELPVADARWRHRHHGAEPPGFPRVHQAAAEVSANLLLRREHAVQCVDEHAGFRAHRLQQAGCRRGRRHGRAAERCPALAPEDGHSARAGMGTYRDIAGRGGRAAG
jgi:hypothetical protein